MKPLLAVSKSPGSPFPRMTVRMKVGCVPGGATEVVMLVYFM